MRVNTEATLSELGAHHMLTSAAQLFNCIVLGNHATFQPVKDKRKGYVSTLAYILGSAVFDTLELNDWGTGRGCSRNVFLSQRCSSCYLNIYFSFRIKIKLYS